MDFNVASEAGGATTLAVQVVPLFRAYGGAAGYTEPFWAVARIHRKTGVAPSTISIELPTKGWGGNAPLMSGPSSPIVNIKQGGRVQAMLGGVALFNGATHILDENWDVDGAMVEGYDDRHLLEGIYLKGRFFKGDDGKVTYQEGYSAWFNEGGLPNRIKGSGDFTYAFCEPMFGIPDGEQAAEPDTNSDKRASYWDPASMWQYVVESKTQAIVGQYIEAGRFPEYAYIPDSLVIPPDAASKLDVNSVNPTLPSTGVRQGEELIFDCTPMNLALQKILDMSGKYALGMDYESADKSTLTIVTTKYDGGGRALVKAVAGQVPIHGQVIGGGRKIDSTKFYTQVSGSSDLVYVETRCQSTSKKSINAQQSESVELITAWDPKIEQLIIDEYNKMIDNLLQPDLEKIIAKYPLVFEAWRLNPQKNFQSGTSESGFPRAQTSCKKILPHMLTTFITKPPIGGVAPYELKTGFRPYWFEYAVEAQADTPSGNGTAQNPATGGDNGVGGNGSQGAAGGGDGYNYWNGDPAGAAAEIEAAMVNADNNVEGDAIGGNEES